MRGEGWEPSLESQGEQPSVRTYFPSPDLRTSSEPFPQSSHTVGYTGPSLLTHTAAGTFCGGGTLSYMGVHSVIQTRLGALGTHGYPAKGIIALKTWCEPGTPSSLRLTLKPPPYGQRQGCPWGLRCTVPIGRR